MPVPPVRPVATAAPAHMQLALPIPCVHRTPFHRLDTSVSIASSCHLGFTTAQQPFFKRLSRIVETTTLASLSFSQAMVGQLLQGASGVALEKRRIESVRSGKYSTGRFSQGGLCWKWNSGRWKSKEMGRPGNNLDSAEVSGIV